MIQRYRRPSDDHSHAGLAVAKCVLHRRVDPIRSYSEGHAHEGRLPPALYDRVAIFIGGRVVRQRGAREFPHEGDVWRHRVWLVRKQRTQNGRADTRTFSHRHGESRPRPAVLVTPRLNTRRAPRIDRKVPPKLSESGDPCEEPCGARTCLDHLAHITGVVVPLTFELIYSFVQNPPDHVVPPLSIVRRDSGLECDMAGRPGGDDWGYNAAHASVRNRNDGVPSGDFSIVLFCDLADLPRALGAPAVYRTSSHGPRFCPDRLASLFVPASQPAGGYPGADHCRVGAVSQRGRHRRRDDRSGLDPSVASARQDK